jgi:NDP-sugar pyrophosphorylase family protein
LIDWLKSYSEIREVLVLAGYRGGQMRDELSKEFGSFVRTIIEDEPLGSGGCLRLAKPYIKNDTSLLIGGDLFVTINLRNLINRHKALGANITITIHGNDHPLDADLIEPDESWCFVQKFLTRPHPENLRAHNLVNAAIFLIEPPFWNYIKSTGNQSFE